MADVATNDQRPQAGDHAFYAYTLILMATALLYVLVLKYSYSYHQVKVPTGDPFTYTLSFYHILDQSRDNYWGTLKSVVSSATFNWYWLHNVMLAVLSPILVKRPDSVVLINLVPFFFATCALFGLLKYARVTQGAAFLLTMAVWLYPFVHGFDNGISLLVLMLETAFFWMLFIAVVSLVMFASNPLNTRYAVLAGVCCGLALWGRGNSLPYVVLALGCPSLVIGWKWLTDKALGRGRVLGNYLLCLLLFAALAAWFYYFTFSNIMSYYSYLPAVHSQSSGTLAAKISSLLHPPEWALKNVPGFFFHAAQDSRTAAWISVACHLVVIAATCVVFARRKTSFGQLRASALRVATATGAVFYASVFLMCLTGLGPFHAHRPFHTFAPMLVGLILVVTCAISSVAFRYRSEGIILQSRWFMPGVVIVVLAGGHYLTRKHTPLIPTPGAATPAELDRFAQNLDNVLQGGSLAMVWYGVYNPPILDYYRSMNDMPPYQHFNKYDYPIFHTIAARVDPQDFRIALRRTMEEADFVIIPEDLQHCSRVYPSSLQERGAMELMDFLNSPTCPKYAVQMVLHDAQACRLLFLKRLQEGESVEGLPLLPRPYGTGAAVSKAVAHALSDRFIPKVGTRTQFAPGALFDGSNTSFWEITGPFPHSVMVEFLKDPKCFLRYKLIADPYGEGDEAPRMPCSWLVKGSKDGTNWFILDERQRELPWKSNEAREYKLRCPGAYKYYEFEFTEGHSANIIRIGEIELLGAGTEAQVAGGGKNVLEMRITEPRAGANYR